MENKPSVVQSLPRQTTSFIGRHDEIADINALLDDPDCQLLTLVGPGGIGKTRLAIEVAASQATSFDNGAYFTNLQPLTEATQVARAIASTLKIQMDDDDDAETQIRAFLSDCHLLLLLDNFEHLLESARFVSELLVIAPRIKIMVTSREALNLREEWLYPVKGLALAQSPDSANLEAYSGIRLFTERARQLKPNFDLATDAQSVVEICNMVEGMPLAIELAASWIKSVSCALIASEIRKNIEFLESRASNVMDRHRSIRVICDHTWQQLHKDEREVFQRLSVFRGGFTAEAAEKVTGASLNILAVLIDKSLIRRENNDRYDIHEFLRQYAESQLAQTRNADAVKAEHSQYFAHFLAQRVPDLKGHRQLAAHAEIEADFENIRQAWQWAVARRDYAVLDQSLEGITLHGYEFSQGSNVHEILRQARVELTPDPHESWHPTWCRILVRSFTRTAIDTKPVERCLAIAKGRQDRVETAFCLATLGELCAQNGDFAVGVEYYEKSLNLYQRLDEPFYAAGVLARLYFCHSRLGDKDAALSCFAESERLRKKIKDKIGLAALVSTRFAYQQRAGHYDLAEASLCEGIALHREVGNLRGIAQYTAHLSRAMFLKGDVAAARAKAEESVQISAAINLTHARAWALLTLSLLDSIKGNYAQAWVHCQESSRLYPVTMRLYAAWCRGIAAVGLSDYEAAKAALYVALDEGHLTLNDSLCTSCLPVAAVIAHHEGKPEQAVELLALAFTHPASPTGWMEQWPLLVQLQDELHTALGESKWDRTWERVRVQDLEQVVQSLMREYRPVPDDPAIQANAALPDPLTPRELEVLCYMSEGLTNREIADQLVIGVSTVKKHITHIYDKLGNSDRVKAINRARSLALVKFTTP